MDEDKNKPLPPVTRNSEEQQGDGEQSSATQAERALSPEKEAPADGEQKQETAPAEQEENVREEDEKSFLPEALRKGAKSYSIDLPGVSCKIIASPSFTVDENGEIKLAREEAQEDEEGQEGQEGQEVQREGSGQEEHGEDEGQKRGHPRPMRMPRQIKQQEKDDSSNLPPKQALLERAFQAMNRALGGIIGDRNAIPEEIPVLPVSDIVLFGHTVTPLFLVRESSKKAIEECMSKNQMALVLTLKKEVNKDKPSTKSLYGVGMVVNILKVHNLPEKRLKVLVQGIAKAKVEEFVNPSAPYLVARITPIEEKDYEKSAETEALMRVVKDQAAQVLTVRGIPAPDLIPTIQGIEEPGVLADLICSTLRLSVEDSQQVLQTEGQIERLSLVSKHLQKEVAVAQAQTRIQEEAKDSISKTQREYFLREQLRAIHKELGDGDTDAGDDYAGLKAALKKASLPKDARAEADKQLRRLSSMHGDSPEANVIQTYLELLSELPWKVLSKEAISITKAKKMLDEDHYGLEKIKDRILEYLSVHKLNPDTKGTILCFVGPPGVGKTSLGKSIARSISRKFERISLGGMHDEAELRGHRRTYIGSMPGRVIQALRHAGTRNPVVILDEIDKIGNDFRGDPQSALLEVLDPEQNSTFSDHYLNLPFDLSKVMFICTANELDPIPPALRDRMEIISLPGYTMQEKLIIAKEHLVAKRVSDNGLAAEDIEITDEAIKGIITGYTREAGVRELERKIGMLCRKVARKKAEREKGPFKIDASDLHGYLGPQIFLDEEKDEKLLPGMTYGLAWTQAGGEVLTVEASILKGKGAVQLTGSLGDVMKESANAAVSYIRSVAEKIGISADFMTEHDIHIHVPDGATPKDGPSAGVTLTTALISALKDVPVRQDLCMTGEIDIKGRVLPVGGIKEKLLGACARGIAHAVIPWQNQKDLEDIPADMRSQISVHPVRLYSEVYELAFKQPEEAATV